MVCKRVRRSAICEASEWSVWKLGCPLNAGVEECHVITRARRGLLLVSASPEHRLPAHTQQRVRSRREAPWDVRIMVRTQLCLGPSLPLPSLTLSRVPQSGPPLAPLILDADGHRILAKYYSPPHAAPEAGHAPAASVNGQHPGGARLGPPGLSTLKEQKAFEKSVHEKTKRGGGEIHPLPPHLLLTKPSTDLSFHIVGPLATSNELMLQAALTAFHDAVSLLLRGQVEKRSVLEGLDMVVLAADELCDDGWARARHYTHVDTRADARPDTCAASSSRPTRRRSRPACPGRAQTRPTLSSTSRPY